MFKASYRFLFALLLACCAAGSGLFWPRFVDAAVPLTGWARADLMPPQSGLIALPVVLFSVAALGMFMFGIFALIDAGFDETKRLHAQDARADRLGHELEDLQRDFETQQGALRAALLERTQLREESARQGHEIAKLKAERAAGGGWPELGPYVLIRVPAQTRSCKILWPNGEVTVYDAEKGAWPEKMKEGAPEPAAVGGSACGEPGRTVPYRIKAEPLKISDLREGDEIVFMGASTEIGVARVLHPFLQGDLGCCNLEIKVVIEHRKGGPQYTITEKQVLGVLRRIGS